MSERRVGLPKNEMKLYKNPWLLGPRTCVECFHSRGQHLCIFIGTKEIVCVGKDFNSNGIGLGHQHGRRFIFLGYQYGRRDVM